MNDSIEAVWKQGFLDQDALVAPQINDLYARKSQHLVDRFIRMARINLICVAGAAVIILAVSIFLGTAYMGAIVAALLGAVAYYGMKQAAKLEPPDGSQDTYHYLKSFLDFLATAMASYARLYRFLYPALIFGVTQLIWAGSGFGQRMLEQDPNTLLVLGMPLSVLIGTLTVAGVAGALAGPIYRQDVEIVYGRVLARLREMLADMEELREGAGRD